MVPKGEAPWLLSSRTTTLGSARWGSALAAAHRRRPRALWQLFDLIDEVSLLPSQARQLCEMLLGSSLPEPEIDYAAFDAALDAALAAAGPVHDPLQRRMRWWVDRQRMARKFAGPAASCLAEGCAPHCVLA